jgi:predicted GNAT family N-acyltransferase
MSALYANTSTKAFESRIERRDMVDLLRSRVHLLRGRDRLLMTMYLENGNSINQMARISGKKTRLSLINKNVVCITRVIIDPRFRGLGLASRLVRETMGQMGRPIVESAAVMGHVNPFFEKAGMTDR